MVRGFLSYDVTITFRGVKPHQIDKIYEKLKCDLTILFFVEKIVYQYAPILKIGTVLPTYRFAKNQIDATINALSEQATNVMRLCRNRGKLETEKIIHDYLCNTVLYDTEYKDSSFECVEPLLFGKGVCEGISKASEFLFDTVGIESLIVHGTSNSCLNCGTNNLSHAWNIVRIRDLYFHLGVTFDLIVRAFDFLRCDYFNLSDADIRLDHIYDGLGSPTCNVNGNYYSTNGMLMLSQNDFSNYLGKCLRNGNRNIVVKLLNVISINKAEKKLMHIAQKNLGRNQYGIKQFQISSNPDQRVFRVHTM